MILLNLIFFAVACLVLIKSGSMLVKTLNKIGIFLGMSEYTLGFILMAFGTSVPELFVGISSALNKITILSLGNVIGSNIADLALVLGFVVILTRRFDIKNYKIKKDVIYVFLIAILPLILMLDHELSRRDGALLLIAFAFYLRRLLKEKRRVNDKLNHVMPFEFVKSWLWLFIGIVLLLISSHFVVTYASILASELAASLILIGLFIVAIGTSLPELVFESKAALTGHKEMALGDLFGSIVINSTLVLGVVSLIYPIVITDFAVLFFAMFFLAFLLTFLTVILRLKKVLTWHYGVLLIFMYVVFVIIEFYIKGVGIL